MTSNISASLLPINPNILFFEGYELSDQSIIPNKNIISTFVPFEDKVEYWIYDFNKNLVAGKYDFLDYNLVQNPSSNNENDTTTIELSPINDLFNFGFDTGQLFTIYNFVKYQLSSTPDNRYFISEISSDRTEIRLKSNNISNDDIFSSFQQLRQELDSSEFFDEFYINFGENKFYIGVNIEIDITQNVYTVLVKLYNALPLNFNLKDEIYIFTKAAESVGYQIEYPGVIDIPTNIKFIQGPNINLEVKDFINNSTELKSKSELLSTNSLISRDNLINILNRKGVTITPNYSYDTFHEFVNFSSAKKRIENFVEKVKQIQIYENDITLLSTITGSTSQSFEVIKNKTSTYSNIENIIKNFDGYEYFLYYDTGSSSYPKLTSNFPYTLYPTTDTTVLEWLGSDIENSQYYGGIILSASLYDKNNQNWLYYTIPEFIRENDSNDQYIEFSNMVGQHFDEVWLYTKEISEKLNSTNDINDGIPLELASDVIASLGYNNFNNNYNNQDNFISLIGENSGSYVPSTGSELITNYIAVNNGEELFQYGNFINQNISSSFPYAIDKVSKEIYKRLYHNMAYLTKKKGTISGLRQLINIWGIPNTILRINEFGGKNKDNINDYDLWYNRYSYAFTSIPSQTIQSRATALIDWKPLQKNYIIEGEEIVPDCIQFRFKASKTPENSFTQSLLVKKSDGVESSPEFDFGIGLYYDPPITGSYSGSTTSEYKDWGVMRFIISGSVADGGDAISNDIYLPFFDGEWWSVMLQRNTHISASNNTQNTTYTLYTKNKTYNGWDGNQIGFEGSASIVSNISTSINEAWNKFGNGTQFDSCWLGGSWYGNNIGGVSLGGNVFSGSFQEFRYYSSPLPEAIFNDYVMNPESIEGIEITGLSSSFSILNFRAPLGNELESTFISPSISGGLSDFISVHPSIVGSPDSGIGEGNLLTTQSFFYGTSSNDPRSKYYVLYSASAAILPYSVPNTEVYFLDQPAVGVRNRVSNKIQIQESQSFGNTLSSLKSIQQNYQINQNYTENINNLEVSFSPQNEINDDIIQTFGYGIISDVLADPRVILSSEDHYPGLRLIAKEYFEKYTKGNIYDYLRLIKYFDNSIFKAIKNYVPARTSVSTGIVIKQHLLERNKIKPVQISELTKISATPEGGNNTSINLKNLELTSSIKVGSFDGGTGGSVEKFNYLDSSFLIESGPNQGNSYTTPFDNIINTQSWSNNIDTVLGTVGVIENEQKEFYDGEYSGSKLTATTQLLFNNPFTKLSTKEPLYSASIFNIGMRDYYSVPEDTVFEIIEGAPSLFDARVYINESMSFSTSSVIWMTSSNDNPDEWYITALALAPSSSNGSYEESAYYLVDHNPWLTSTENIFLLPPTSSFNVNYPYSNDFSRRYIPYITFPLPNITNGYNSINELSTQYITTFGLELEFNTPSFPPPFQALGWNGFPNTSLGGQQTRVWIFKTGSLSNSRPILPVSSSDSIPVGLYSGSSGIKYISPSNNYINFVSYFQNTLLTSSINEGEINVVLQGTTHQATSSEGMEYWYPMSVLINNIDLNGDNNIFSFDLNPNVSFDLTSIGNLRNDGTGVVTSRIDTSFISSIFTTNFEDAGGNIIYIYFNTDIDADGLGTQGDRPNTYITSSNITLVNFDPYIDPSIATNFANSPKFENSDFFATINNYNDNRENSYLEDIEYEDGINIPSNLSLILNRTAKKTQTPDSNYTSKRSTILKYEGSKLNSANYNFYTAKSNNAEFIDNSIGVWEGDVSYGRTAIIDKNPIYFAHFQKSFYNPSIFNTVNYIIDQLIEVPFENIQGTSIEPKIIKIEGDNSKLFEITSTFEKNRKLSAIYESEVFNGVNYSLNSLDKLQIYNPGSKYITTATNQIEPGQIPSSSFARASYRRFEKEMPDNFIGGNNGNFNRFFDKENVNMITGSGFLQLEGYFNYGSSNIGVDFDGNMGVIMLNNNINEVSQISTPSTPEIVTSSTSSFYTGLWGPFLSIMHHYNYCLKNDIDETFFPLPQANIYSSILSGIDKNNPNNYFRFNPISSSLPQYEDTNEPFLIERGDTIRISYTTPGTSSIINTQDFTVLGIGFTDYPSGSIDNNFSVFTNFYLSGSGAGTFVFGTGSFLGPTRGTGLITQFFHYPISPNNVIPGSVRIRQYNRISVYPDPSTLSTPIPNGHINEFTHIKRKNADNIVNAISSPLKGTVGASTFSGGGFIIPNDLTSTQKRNVQTLIAQLKAKNNFRNDDIE
jgi:hypothetical protein